MQTNVCHPIILTILTILGHKLLKDYRKAEFDRSSAEKITNNKQKVEITNDNNTTLRASSFDCSVLPHTPQLFTRTDRYVVLYRGHLACDVRITYDTETNNLCLHIEEFPLIDSEMMCLKSYSDDLNWYTTSRHTQFILNIPRDGIIPQMDREDHDTEIGAC